MKRLYSKVLVVCGAGIGMLIALLFCGQAFAALPSSISFQGKLTNPDGTNVADGSYSILFTLYDGGTASGGGTSVWSETQSVAVSGGIFNVQLGSVNTTLASTVNFNDSPLYLAMKVGSDSEMSPRIQLTSSPYAFNSASLGGLVSSNFVQIAQGLQTDASTADTLAINKTGAGGNIVNLQSNGSSIFVIGNDGSATLYGNDGSTQLFSTNAASKLVNFANGILTVDADGSITRNPGAGKTSTTNLASGSQSLFVAAAQQTDDLVRISNAGQAPTTDNANGIHVDYSGGAAAVEGAGMRIDYTPGGTSGGAWSGLRIVANGSGAASGVASYGLRLEGPASSNGGTNTAIYIGTGWDIGLDVQSGGLQLGGITSEPNAPTSNNLLIYAKDVAGRMLLKTKGPTGVDTPLQPALFFNAIAMIMPQTGSTITQWGMPNTTVGTASTPTPTATNMHTSMKRTSVTSSTTAGSASELRSAQYLVWRGNAAGLGGFFYTCRFGVNSTVSTQQLLIGLRNATAATSTTAVPSSLTNFIGVGWDNGDGNLQIMSNDASGTATKIDLGSLFPANNTTAMYEFVLYAAPDGTSVGYRLQRLDTGDITSGSLSTDLPASNLFLSPHEYMNNGGTAAAVVMDVNRVYIESDN
jgi:hypothetical protein